jgi:hypothetical protein
MFRPFKGNLQAKILVIKHKKDTQLFFTQLRPQFNKSFSHAAIQYGRKIKKTLKKKYVGDVNRQSDVENSAAHF